MVGDVRRGEYLPSGSSVPCALAVTDSWYHGKMVYMEDRRAGRRMISESKLDTSSFKACIRRMGNGVKLYSTVLGSDLILWSKARTNSPTVCS
jgi:hypothetical protein